jgi:hypothetical protein
MGSAAVMGARYSAGRFGLAEPCSDGCGNEVIEYLNVVFVYGAASRPEQATITLSLFQPGYEGD